MTGINKLVVEVNSACNNKCVYCYLDDRTSNDPGKSRSLARRISEFRKQGVRNIDFTGGEPTLWPGLLGLVRYSSDIGFEEVTLITNGRMLAAPGYLGKVIDAGVTRIIISFDGPDAKTAESITRTPGSFSQTLKAIKAAKECDIGLGATIVVVKANYRKLPVMFRKLYRLGVSQVNVQFLLPGLDFGRSIPPEIVPRYRDAVPYLRKAIRENREVRANVHFIPYCCAPGLEANLSFESVKDDRFVINFQGKDYNLGHHLRKGSVKVLKCKGCPYDKRCIGFFYTYARELGISDALEDGTSPPWKADDS